MPWCSPIIPPKSLSSTLIPKGIIGLCTFLCLFSLVPSSFAAIGTQTSPIITLDTVDPVLSLDPFSNNATFFTDQIVTFHWTSFDHNPGATIEDFEASIVIDSSIVESFSWYPEIEEFTWEYTIPVIQSGDCQLQVVATDAFGNSTTVSSATFTILLSTSGTPEAPATLFLGAPTPNPFNPSTTVNFSAPAGSRISLAVYDARGRLVRNLAGGNSDSGMVAVRWDGRDNEDRAQPGGVYFFVLDAHTAAGTRRLAKKATFIP